MGEQRNLTQLSLRCWPLRVTNVFAVISMLRVDGSLPLRHWWLREFYYLRGLRIRPKYKSRRSNQSRSSIST